MDPATMVDTRLCRARVQLPYRSDVSPDYGAHPLDPWLLYLDSDERSVTICFS